MTLTFAKARTLSNAIVDVHTSGGAAAPSSGLLQRTEEGSKACGAIVLTYIVKARHQAKAKGTRQCLTNGRK